MIEITNEDIKRFIGQYKGEKFHAILCDPPYHLTSITKRFGKEDSAPAKFGKDGLFQRASKGFMGKNWDGGGIAFEPEVWHALGELLYPGGFVMAYGGTRTYHRMAVAIEDAGLIIHPAIGWVQTMGFPKATRIDTQIDRKLGLEREKGEVVKTGFASGTHRHAGTEKAWGFDDEYSTSQAAHPLSKTWEGHRYGLQALKPSFEFICVAQRPYGKRPLDDILMNGAGAINIGDRTNSGRWPANVAMAHLPECEMIGYEEDSYTINQFTDGAKPWGKGAGHDFESTTIPTKREIWKCASGCPVNTLQEQANKNGSVTDVGDVFYSPQYTEEEIEFADKFMFSSKVTPQERDAGLNHLPEREVAYSEYRENMKDTDSFVSKYPDGEARPMNKTRNPHPTLKPIMLNKWLATLLLPPVEYAPRRILVPFAGAMSEAIGCDLAGWEEVVAVELEEEYARIGQERVKYWTSIRSSGADAKKLDKRQLSFDEL